MFFQDSADTVGTTLWSYNKNKTYELPVIDKQDIKNIFPSVYRSLFISKSSQLINRK